MEFADIMETAKEFSSTGNIVFDCLFMGLILAECFFCGA